MIKKDLEVAKKTLTVEAGQNSILSNRQLYHTWYISGSNPIHFNNNMDNNNYVKREREFPFFYLHKSFKIVIMFKSELHCTDNSIGSVIFEFIVMFFFATEPVKLV